MSEWRTLHIDDIATKIAMGPFGSNIKVETFVDDGVPVISGQHLHGTRLDESSGYNFITEEHAAKLANSNVFPGDIIFTHAGTIGQVALIPESACFDRYVISQRQFYLRVDPSKALASFVTRWFHSPNGRHRLLMHASQVGVPSISRPATNLKAIEITLPSLPEQKAISAVFDVIDDKIELNRQMNETLEAMARALFKDWFVDFGPTKAKMEGRHPYLAEKIWNLFPDTLDDDRKPKGWGTTKLEYYLELAYGKSLPKGQRRPGKVNVYGSGGIAGSHDEALTDSPTVIVGRKGTVGSLYWEDGPAFPIDTVFFVIPKKGSKVFNFWLLESLPLRDMNTDAAVPGLNRSNVYRLEVARIPEALILAFDEIVSQLWNKRSANLKETNTLIKTRDLLLPKLMSGEIGVKSQNKQLQEIM